MQIGNPFSLDLYTKLQLVSVLVFQVTLQAALVVYPAPPNLGDQEDGCQSSAYQVQVTQHGVSWDSFVYEIPADKKEDYRHNVCSFTTFSFQGKVSVTVKKLGGEPIRSATVYPLSYQIQPQILAHDTIRFELDQPGRKMAIILNDDWDSHPLLVFGDPLEEAKPEPSDPNVVYYGPGVHEAGQIRLHSGQTLYIEGGAYVKGWIHDENLQNVTVRGRGILSAEDRPRKMTKGRRGYNSRTMAFDEDSAHILVEGISFIQQQGFAVSVHGRDHVVRGIKIIGNWHPTADGIVVGDNSLIEDCFIKADDDAIKIYADNVVARRCVIWQMENGGVFQHGWTRQQASGCHVYDMDIIRTEWITTDRSPRAIISSVNMSGSGGNHVFENIRVDGGGGRIISMNTKGGGETQWTNVVIRNLTVSNWQPVKNIINGPGFQNITFENLKLNGKYVRSAEEASLEIRNGAGNISFEVTKQADERPNVVLILVDDMGYADIGCYGGEILTPHLDSLARNGLRFSQFYNTARCCPTRASLLTGLYQHQAGMGAMTGAEPTSTKAYQGYLNEHCVTMAEVLKPVGYHTYMVGKWHVGQKEQGMWPCQRGFDRYYGILSGACNYFKPEKDRGLKLNNEEAPEPGDGYYTTDAFTDYAIQFLQEQEDDNPFFLYVAYNAPHWPLHAKREDVEKFVGKYTHGWDKLREQRWQRQLDMGLVKKEWGLSPRDPKIPAWDTFTEEERKDLDGRMATYAAMVHCVDYNIGRIIDTLKQQGKLDNTLVLFLSDNGACPEPWTVKGRGEFKDVNDPGAGGIWSYGQGWSNAGNTPFRRHKTETHEGGISTPLIAHWPAGIKQPVGSTTHHIGHIRDIMPTVLEISGAAYPEQRRGASIHPLQGQSLVPLFEDGTRIPATWMFWEHIKEGAVRNGPWKALLNEKTGQWFLYHIETDRNELKDLAEIHPEIMSRLKSRWYEWAVTHQVIPKRKP